jgi:resolvase-like protein
MQTAIGYLRGKHWGTRPQRLGLVAQRHEIEAFGAREGFSVKSWHQDVQTGAAADALLLRPGLATALKEANATRCPLIVARLDRLSRNLHFISGLMKHRVHFIVAAFGRDCDYFACTSMLRSPNKNGRRSLNAARLITRRARGSCYRSTSGRRRLRCEAARVVIVGDGGPRFVN